MMGYSWTWWVKIMLICLLSHCRITTCSQASNTTSVVNETPKKIAFLYLTRGHMPLEDIWREFFNWRTNPTEYSIYVHPHHGFKFPSTSFFYNKEVNSTSAKIKWGGMSQVRAIKALVRAALEDPTNAWFCLMSESCIPLHPMPKWRSVLFAHNKSIVNACPMSHGVMETEARWKDSLAEVGMNKGHWRKSATWFALNRKHAQVFVDEKALEPGWEPVPCCDEHYLPSVLAFYGLDNETTCSDGFVNAKFLTERDSHPHTYGTDEIGPDLFAHLNQAVGGGAGFSNQCSGFPELCHFTARKFSGASKQSLLENIDLILSDEDRTYDGDPFDYQRTMLRYEILNASTAHSGEQHIGTSAMSQSAVAAAPSTDTLSTRHNEMKKFWVIENGQLREIPDNITLAAMHFVEAKASLLTIEEKKLYGIGPSYPSRKDGVFIKSPKQNQVYLVKGGKRHSIPNLDTFYVLNGSIPNIKISPQHDIDQIPLGPPVPDLRGHPKDSPIPNFR